MTFSNTAPKAQMKSFVTETELEDKRAVRQAEWEKVRKPDQPLGSSKATGHFVVSRPIRVDLMMY